MNSLHKVYPLTCRQYARVRYRALLRLGKWLALGDSRFSYGRPAYYSLKSKVLSGRYSRVVAGMRCDHNRFLVAKSLPLINHKQGPPACRTVTCPLPKSKPIILRYRSGRSKAKASSPFPRRCFSFMEDIKHVAYLG